ncbi:MAG: YHYH protein [Chloroflexota bacterium]
MNSEIVSSEKSGVPSPLQATSCGSEHFLGLTTHAANAAYAAPQLAASCENGLLTVRSNNIPNFEFVPTTPNALEAQQVTFSLPANPTFAAETTAVPLGGPSAITVNGILIFGPTEARRDGYRDPYFDDILDYCNGHTAPGGVYHFHASPTCLFENSEGKVGLVIGYAFDGYPILNPYICADAACADVQKVESSWVVVDESVTHAWNRHAYVAGAGDLDECNGMTFADGSYAYFATDTFPYFMGCYRGEIDANTLGIRLR